MHALLVFLTENYESETPSGEKSQKRWLFFPKAPVNAVS